VTATTSWATNPSCSSARIPRATCSASVIAPVSPTARTRHGTRCLRGGSGPSLACPPKRRPCWVSRRRRRSLLIESQRWDVRPRRGTSHESCKPVLPLHRIGRGEYFRSVRAPGAGPTPNVSRLSQQQISASYPADVSAGTSVHRCRDERAYPSLCASRAPSRRAQTRRSGRGVPRSNDRLCRLTAPLPRCASCASGTTRSIPSAARSWRAAQSAPLTPGDIAADHDDPGTRMDLCRRHADAARES
jgi:hypothetical protein